MAMHDRDGLPGGQGASCSGTAYDAAAVRFNNWVMVGHPVHTPHTVAGPGECVLSTSLGNSTQVLSGTSMACLHVAGAVALCFSTVTGGPGPCAALTVPQIVSKFVADAAANAAAGRGFRFDRRSGGDLLLREYGNLVDVAAF